ELCCGSGYNANHFYAPVARELHCVDFDPRAIELAQRFHQQDNIRYAVADIRDGMPAGPFDNVIWDAAIEHFTEAEIAAILGGIHGRLVAGGLLCGYTVAEVGDAKQHHDHEYEFKGMRDLGDLLKRHFAHVLVLENIHFTIQPERHNLVFFASDGVLPFDPGWPRCYRP
ncbi:MAG: class I SAM-dependent methyltransferase, partial [Alphaproteobacteria bacterium]|nr:class I SAM-dependent methyltransferase [Alphaproteobacteria bacterium]